MINKTEKITAIMSGYPFAEVRAAYIAAARVAAGRVSDLRQWMRDNGFEQVDVSDGALMLDDGREIIRAHGLAWVLRNDVHARRLASAFEQAARKDVASQESPSEQQVTTPQICTAIIDGHLCGGDLSATPVCPKCALGKQGVAQITTCDVCGAQTAVMR